MCPVAKPIRFNGQDERCARVPEGIAVLEREHGEIDVLVVQESIVSSLHQKLVSDMREAGFPFTTRTLRSPFLSTKLVDGGVAIFSRHPIIEQDTQVFTGDCLGSDCLASKGIVYARIRKGESWVISLFGTHLQAWEQKRTRAIRREQATQIRKFMDRHSPLPNEPVILCGDFNVDRYTQPTQLEKLCAIMGVTRFPIEEGGHPFTSDPKTNALMGNDGDESYANDQYPNGCYHEYQMTGSCPCCPQEFLDYFTYRDPAPQEASFKCVKLKVKPFQARLSLKTDRTIEDVSDHYPIMATFKTDPSLFAKSLEIIPADQRASWEYWLIFALIVVSFLAAAAVAYWYYYRTPSKTKRTKEK